MAQKAKQLIPYFVTFILFLLLSSYMESRNDDLIFQAGIEKYGSLHSWAKWFGWNWGGRIIPQGVLVVLLQLPSSVFHLINAGFLTLLTSMVSNIFGIKIRNHEGIGFMVISVMMITLIPMQIFHTTVFWKCASVLYIWGFATLFISLIPFLLAVYGETVTWYEYIISAAATLYTTSFEQTGALLLGCTIVCLYNIIRYKKVPVQLIFLSILIIGTTIYFCFVLPGNSVRLESEIVAWYSNYSMYSLGEKLLIGLNYTVTGIEEEIMPVLLLLCILLLIKSYQDCEIKADCKRLNNIMLYVVTGFFLLRLVDIIGKENSSEGSGSILSSIFSLYSPEIVIYDISSIKVFLNIFHYLMFIILGCCLIFINQDRVKRMLAFMFYFGGFCTSIMMGFSPTIHESGSRPRFICYFLLVALVLSEMFSLGKKKQCIIST